MDRDKLSYTWRRSKKDRAVLSIELQSYNRFGTWAWPFIFCFRWSQFFYKNYSPYTWPSPIYMDRSSIRTWLANMILPEGIRDMWRINYGCKWDAPQSWLVTLSRKVIVLLRSMVAAGGKNVLLIQISNISRRWRIFTAVLSSKL